MTYSINCNAISIFLQNLSSESEWHHQQQERLKTQVKEHPLGLNITTFKSATEVANNIKRVKQFLVLFILFCQFLNKTHILFDLGRSRVPQYEYILDENHIYKCLHCIPVQTVVYSLLRIKDGVMS